MNNELLKERITEFLKNSLKESRYNHTMGVRDTAIQMAIQEGADIEKTEIAALLHDIARNIPVPVMNNYITQLGLDDIYMDNVNLAHSKIAVAMATSEFGIDDREILDAVAFHTTGRAGMSTLEKIIFLSDAIEPGRDYYGLDEIRAKAAISLDMGCLESLRRTIEFLNSKKIHIHNDTVDAYNYFKEKINE